MRRALATILLLALVIGLAAEKPAANVRLERIPNESVRSEIRGRMRVDLDTGAPTTLFLQSTPVHGSTPEAMARDYLQKHFRDLGLISAGDLEWFRTRETPGGWRVHFIQQHHGTPVWHGRMVVSINRGNEVVFVSNNARRVWLGDVKPAITAEEAEASVRSYLDARKVVRHQADLVVYAHSFPHRLAWRVALVTSEKPIGDWEALVDAETGEIFRVEDRSLYIDGDGYVFDPCPVTDAATYYGQPGFVDNADADSDSLTAHLKQLPILDITENGGVYSLVGPYAEIVDIEPPYTGLYTQDSDQYLYTRSAEEFEAVNTYYHIDNSMRYLNETLGYNIMPYQYTGGVQFDPNGLGGDANAHYSTTSGQIGMGSPSDAVDTGEDTAIIRHELGHAIHDWATYGGLSQVEGLSEGIADYWAQSHNRSFGIFEPGDTQYDYFCMWGLQPNLGGDNMRVTNFSGSYPQALNGSVHHDGQLWSSSMMSIYDIVGRDTSDKLLWEAISMTTFNTNQPDAAFAVLQADLDLFNGEHYDDIAGVFQQRGYISNPLMPAFTSDVTGGPGPLTVQFTDLTFAYPDPVISWEWDFDNDGNTDSYDQNPQWTFTDPGLYSVTLSVASASYSETMTLSDYISVNAGVFVFEGAYGAPNYSGAWIRDKLIELGVNPVYSVSFPSSLLGYDAVFLSLGNVGQSSQEGIIPDDVMGGAILEYALTGGNTYFESSSTFGGAQLFGIPDYEVLWAAFGISGATFPSQQNPINLLTGEDASFVEGVQFSASNQTSNWYIDHYTPAQGATPLFYESNYGVVGLANEGVSGQKTVCFSYALAELVDGDTPNTRDHVFNAILDYFDMPVFNGGFTVSQNTGHAPLTIGFSDVTVANPVATSWAWDFDNDGNIDSNDQNPVHLYEEPGVYTVSLTVSNGDVSENVVMEDVIQVFAGESALLFTEDDQMAMTPSNNNLNITGPFTIEAWIKPNDWGIDNVDGRILHKGAFSLYIHEEGGIIPDHSLAFYTEPASGGLSFAFTGENTITLDDWHYIAVTYDGQGDMHIYIDGRDEPLQHVNPLLASLRSNSNDPLVIGNNYDQMRGFSGAIDEVRLWDVQRSRDEIFETAGSTLYGDESHLVGYWPMNEGFGELLDDMTIYDHDFEITGGAWCEGTDFVIVDVDDPAAPAAEFALQGCRPNPFNPSTTVLFSLPEAGDVRLEVYNVRGQRVRTLTTGKLPAGDHEIVWNGVNDREQPVASGVYLMRLQAGGRTATSKALLLK